MVIHFHCPCSVFIKDVCVVKERVCSHGVVLFFGDVPFATGLNEHAA